MPVRYLMEFPSDVIGFTLACYIRRQYLAWERSREIETQLAAARMALLTKQLQPHFLFNALNTISALMYEDVPKADRVLHRLGDFLRSTIDLRETATIPLSEELLLLENYLAVMRARMETQLEVLIESDATAASIPVPPLFLQPLVENAIEHGRSEADGRVRIELQIHRNEKYLEGALRDHGGGWKELAEGYGLEAVRKRLSTLYGNRATLAASNHPEGGALLEWKLPLC
jgi:LytS/YehU family sensor histidine kinase